MSAVVAIDCDLPAEPLLLARRIWDQSCPALLWTQHGVGPSYVACNPAALASGHDPEPELSLDPRAGSDAGAPRWLGVLPYEAERGRLERPAYSRPDERARPLMEQAQWWRYPAVARIEHGRVRLVGDSAAVVQALLTLLSRTGTCPLEVQLTARDDALAEQSHRQRIERAIARIFEGDVYEVNVARRIELDVQGNALGVLERISRWAQAEYAAALVLPDGAELVSTSPELCLELEPNGHCRTLPIKGTRPRGQDPLEDARLAQELDADPKEQAELAMVIDLERNDLGRVATSGSVRAGQPYISQLTSVFHRQAEVAAQLRPGVGRAELLASMLPSGSVTGAPKVRAMELIAELEAERRGLYTGAFGFVSHAGGMKLAMAIRTLCRRGNTAHYFTGGGIVADSVPEREVLETGWKALQIKNALS